VGCFLREAGSITLVSEDYETCVSIPLLLALIVSVAYAIMGKKTFIFNPRKSAPSVAKNLLSFELPVSVDFGLAIIVSL
jgi:hypothetical protein